MKASYKDKLIELLTHRHLPLMAALLAVMLTLPSLGGGLFMDDNFISMVVQQPKTLPVELPHMLDTFCFMNGDSKVLKSAIDYGSMPWWVDPNVKGCFWRPITSITHYIDFRLWPDRVWLMHLQSVLLYGALVLAAALVFRRFMGVTPAAGLAAILFAVEDAHIIPVSWIANRNSIVACLFGLIAIGLHDRWRKEGGYIKGAAAIVVFALALFSAEAGIATMAYITAYALVLDTGSLRKRLLSLMPYIVLIISWRMLWSGLGYGVHNIPLYADPIGEPIEFMRRLFMGLPQMITSQFAVHTTEALALATELWPWTWGISAAITVMLGMLFGPLIASDKTARFFALGTLFALVPVCSTLPQSRNLMFAGIGALGLMSIWLMNRPRDRGLPRMKKAVAVFFIVIHLIIAPLTLSVGSSVIVGQGSKLFSSFTLPEMGDLKGQDIIVVNHPAPFDMAYTLGNRAIEGKSMPAHARVLSQVFTPIIITRTSVNELHLRTSHGIPGLFSRIVFSTAGMVKKDEVVRAEGMTARFTAIDPSGFPTEAVYTFDKNLDDASMRWLTWSEDSFKPFTLPRVGQSVRIPGVWLPFGLKYKKLD